MCRMGLSEDLAPARPGSVRREITRREITQREIIVSRVRRFSRRLPGMVLGLLIAAPLAPAAGQNLDAGKSASQIFSEVCANCHRSPREFKSNPGASFLREHYTTGSEMASTMAAYISGGGNEPRGPGGPQQKRQPNPAAAARDAPAPDNSRDPRRSPIDARTEAKPDPKADAKADAKTDARALPAAATRARPGSVRAEGTAEVKQATVPPAPTKPALEEFEE
jgi:hypothetical protein